MGTLVATFKKYSLGSFWKYLVGTPVGTFKKYPPLTCWVKGKQFVSEPSMNSQWTCWVISPLPPVIIDLLTSMVHLVPSKQNYRAADIAEILFNIVYKLHRLPEQIISDRDSLFTSHFWKRLHRLLGTELRMSSAFHPQTDSATERANRTITQMIRQCISHWGQGGLEPVITCWEHCDLWLNLPGS